MNGEMVTFDLRSSSNRPSSQSIYLETSQANGCTIGSPSDPGIIFFFPDKNQSMSPFLIRRIRGKLLSCHIIIMLRYLTDTAQKEYMGVMLLFKHDTKRVC